MLSFEFEHNGFFSGGWDKLSRIFPVSFTCEPLRLHIFLFGFFVVVAELLSSIFGVRSFFSIAD